MQDILDSAAEHTSNEAWSSWPFPEINGVRTNESSLLLANKLDIVYNSDTLEDFPEALF